MKLMNICTILALFFFTSLSGMQIKELFTATENDRDEEKEEVQIVHRDLLKSHRIKELRKLLDTNNFDPNLCFINAQEVENRNSLFEALELESFDTMRLLLRKGANPNVVDAHGDSIVHVILTSLMVEQNANQTMKQGLTTQYANDDDQSKYNFMKNQVVRSLEETFPAKETKILALIKTLLKKGANISQQNTQGLTVTEYAEQHNLENVLTLMNNIKKQNIG